VMKPLSAPHLTKSGEFEGDAHRAIYDIARCMLLHVSDRIVADPLNFVSNMAAANAGLGLHQADVGACGAWFSR